MNAIDKAIAAIDVRNYSPLAVEPGFVLEAINMVDFVKKMADQHKRVLNNKNAPEAEKRKSYNAIKGAMEALR